MWTSKKFVLLYFVIMLGAIGYISWYAWDVDRRWDVAYDTQKSLHDKQIIDYEKQEHGFKKRERKVSQEINLLIEETGIESYKSFYQGGYLACMSIGVQVGADTRLAKRDCEYLILLMMAGEFYNLRNDAIEIPNPKLPLSN